LDNVVDLIQLCRRYALEVVPLAASAAEHVGIIDAILARDVEKSQRLLRDHLRRASESLATYLEKHPEFSRQTP
jgi:DNA-binding GntR family transcriptional regulator